MRAVSTFCVSVSLRHTFIRARAHTQSLQKPANHGCDSTHLETSKWVPSKGEMSAPSGGA